MRKVSLILAVLLFAAPAWAANVTVTATQVGDTNEVTITYVTDGNLPRAFALAVEVNDGVTIDILTPNHEGESTVALKGYGIFPGTIDINDSGDVNDYGTPVAPNTPPDNPGQLGSSSIVIEMGSLYDVNDSNNAPSQSGTLCSFNVSGECYVNLAEEDTYRGGIVMEDPDETPSVALNGCWVILQNDCLIGGNAGTKEKSDWDDWGKPDCWCYQYQCRGDINGQKTTLWRVQSKDLTIFRAAFFQKDPELAAIPNGICADLNHVKTTLWRVQSKDLTIFRTYFFVKDPGVPPCDEAPIITGPYNFWTTPP